MSLGFFCHQFLWHDLTSAVTNPGFQDHLKDRLSPNSTPPFLKNFFRLLAEKNETKTSTFPKRWKVISGFPHNAISSQLRVLWIYLGLTTTANRSTFFLYLGSSSLGSWPLNNLTIIFPAWAPRFSASSPEYGILRLRLLNTGKVRAERSQTSPSDCSLGSA